MVSDGRSRRAQLILVGAVVIAAVIIGLTVLVNSVLFTQTVGSDAVNSRVDATTTTDYEVRKGIRSLLLRVNHRHEEVTATDIRTLAKDNVNRYSRLLSEAKATSRPVGMNSSLDTASSTLGVRFVQSADGPMPTWNPVPTDDREVGWFTMNVNLSNTMADQFVVEVENESDDVLELAFRKAGDDLEINSSLDGVEASTTCDPSSGRVLLDVYAGTSYSDEDCTFPGTALMSGPDGTDGYDVQFVDGDNLHGKFSLVIDGTSPPGGSPDECHSLGADSEDPCWMPVIWDAAVSTDVTGEGLEYTNEYTISVYSRNR